MDFGKRNSEREGRAVRFPRSAVPSRYPYGFPSEHRRRCVCAGREDSDIHPEDPLRDQASRPAMHLHDAVRRRRERNGRIES